MYTEENKINENTSNIMMTLSASKKSKNRQGLNNIKQYERNRIRKVTANKQFGKQMKEYLSAGAEGALD
jgi:hypothetical protein